MSGRGHVQAPVDAATPPIARARRPFALRLARTLAVALPHRTLFGPVFRKEMRIAGRRKKQYVLRSVYALIMTIVLATALSQPLTLGMERWQGSGAGRASTLTATVCIAVAWLQFLLLGVMAPSLGSGTIVEEKIGRTLAVLSTTPLTAWEIVHGKFASRFVLMAVLALIPAPVLLYLRVFGGVSAEFVLGSTAIAISTVALGIAAAVLASTGASTTSRASSHAALIVLGVHALPLLLYALGAMAMFRGAVPPPLLFATCGPIVLAALQSETLSTTGPNALFPWGATWLWIIHCSYILAAAAGCLVLASSMLRRVMLAEAGGGALDRMLARRRLRGKGRRTVAPAPDAPPQQRSQAIDAPPLTTPSTQIEQHGTGIGLDELLTSTHDPVREHSRTVGDRPILWRELNHRPKKRLSLRLDRLRLGRVLSRCEAFVIGGLVAFAASAGVLHLATWAFDPGFRLSRSALNIAAVAISVVAGVVAVRRHKHQRGRARSESFLARWGLVAIAAMAIIPVWLEIYLHLHVSFVIVVGVLTVLCFLGSASGASASLAAERDKRTWETLLTTPVRAGHIVWGKAIASGRKMLMTVAAVVLFLSAYVATGLMHPIVLVHVGLALFGIGAVLIGSGMYLGSVLRNGSRATAMNLLFGFALWLGPFILLAIASMIWWDTGDEFFEPAAMFFTWINPFAHIVLSIGTAACERYADLMFDDRFWSGRWDFDISEYEMGQVWVGPLEMTTIVLATTALHVGLGAVLAHMATGVVARRTHRPA